MEMTVYSLVITIEGIQLSKIPMGDMRNYGYSRGLFRIGTLRVHCGREQVLLTKVK